jgi:hypothetical protein
MNHRERFVHLFTGKSVDRIPCYFFGTWPETKTSWASNGYDVLDNGANSGPNLPGMDPDWEDGMWNCHGMANCEPIGDIPPKVLEKGDGYEIIRGTLGEVVRHRTDGTSMPHTITPALLPIRSSWEQFMKRWRPDDPQRNPDSIESLAARLAGQERVRAFMGGSLYGWLRNHMGVENISYLLMDDIALYEEMVSYTCDVFLTVMEPVLKHAEFEFVYFFEDCCGSAGPLFSPRIGQEILQPYYKKMIRFYKDHGVKLALIDSDGQADLMVPMWLESGFDVVFPVEVGSWGGSVAGLREKYGNQLCAMGGINKHVIGHGTEAIRAHLSSLSEEVAKGGYLHIPDHRIPPSIGYDQMMDYVSVFHEIFG